MGLDTEQFKRDWRAKCQAFGINPQRGPTEPQALFFTSSYGRITLGIQPPQVITPSKPTILAPTSESRIGRGVVSSKIAIKNKDQIINLDGAAIGCLKSRRTELRGLRLIEQGLFRLSPIMEHVVFLDWVASQPALFRYYRNAPERAIKGAARLHWIAAEAHLSPSRVAEMLKEVSSELYARLN